MKNACWIGCIVWFILGGLVGAGITYSQVKCQTSGVNIKLQTDGQNGPGISITKTGSDKE